MDFKKVKTLRGKIEIKRDQRRSNGTFLPRVAGKSPENSTKKFHRQPNADL